MNAVREHYCRDCRRQTPQRILISENGYPQGRHVDTFRCETCGLLLISMGDVPDAEGLCLWVIHEWHGRRRAAAQASGESANVRGAPGEGIRTRSSDRWLDFEDAFGHLRERIVVIWAKWDPGRGVPFRAYATGELRNDLKDWLRSQVGRDRPKPFANALGLDELAGSADGLDDDGVDGGGGLEALVGGAVDDDAHSLADLRRVLVRRGRELDELDRERGVGAYARPPR